jgi:hypothetical protein
VSRKSEKYYHSADRYMSHVAWNHLKGKCHCTDCM